MKIILSVLCALLIHSGAQAKEITIGLIPGDGPEIKSRAESFADHLQKRLGISVNIYVPKSYQRLIDAMKEKKVDFAFFTAMSFVYAEKEANAKVLLKSVWDQPYYFSTIITKQGSKINSISDLKGKRIAFVDKKSTSGYLLPTLELQDKKIEYNSIFTGNHKASVEKLSKGEVDAVAVFCNSKDGKKGAWDLYFPNQKMDIKNLWVSQSLPTDPFTVRGDFYKENRELTYEVMFALLDMPKLNKEKNVLKETLGVTKLVTANSSQYEPIRKLIKKLH